MLGKVCGRIAALKIVGKKKIVEENVLKNSLGKYVCNIRCRNMEPLCHAPCMFPQVSRSLRETKNH